MNTETYTDEALRTKSELFYGDRIPGAALKLAIEYRLAAAKGVDDTKKTLFYGKPDSETTISYKDTASRFDQFDHQLPHDLTHALLGVDSESAELLKVYVDLLSYPEKLDELKAKFVDEAGDVVWYLNLLFKFLGVSWDEVLQFNIDKLKARYPEKFEEELALNHND